VGRDSRWPRLLTVAVVAVIVTLVLVVLAGPRVVLLVDATPPAMLEKVSLVARIAAGVVAVLTGAIRVVRWALSRARTERGRTLADRLRIHLGRTDLLPQFGEDSKLAQRLGVHEAINLPLGAPEGLDPDLPSWVTRGDIESNIREWMSSARREGGFLVLAGDSSVGKSRLLYECAKDELAGWWVLAPDWGDGELVNAVAAADDELPPLVVWLDELQRFLPGPWLGDTATPVNAAAVRQLLDAPTPVVILGSLWLERVLRLRDTAKDEATGGYVSRYPEAVDVLQLGRHLTLTSFTEEERVTPQARAVAERDPRVAIALSDAVFGFTQTLAGAPEIMRRYHQASPGGKALLHAAIDAERLGCQPPLAAELLEAASRGYLSGPPQKDLLWPDVLGELTRTTGPDDRGTAPLQEMWSPGYGKVVGYRATDFLYQHAARARRSEVPTEITWQALTDHVLDPLQLERLGVSAERRLLYRRAAALFRRSVALSGGSDGASNARAAWGLATVGDPSAAGRLALLLDKQGDLDELRRLADAGDASAGEQLATSLAVEYDLDGLRVRARAGDQWAGEALALLLLEASVLRRLADAGDASADGQLAAMLARERDLDGQRSRAGDEGEAPRLAELLELKQGDAAHRWSGWLLADRGYLDRLRAWADAGAEWAGELLAALLADQGDLDGLRARARAGDQWAARRMAALSAEQGDLDELRRLADAGDQSAAHWLASRLAELGHVDELRNRANTGDQQASERLADLLAEQGDIDGAVERMRVPADSGDLMAARKLADLLAGQGDVDELRNRANAGDWQAGDRLRGLLVQQGDVDELRNRAHAGDWQAGDQLASLLVQQGDLGTLQAWADAGDRWAVRRVAVLSAEQGDLDELRRLTDSGDAIAAWKLVELLADNEAHLRSEVQAGNPGAAETLLRLLRRLGRDDDADRLHREGLDGIRRDNRRSRM
jgi:hypothetical protein